MKFSNEDIQHCARTLFPEQGRSSTLCKYLFYMVIYLWAYVLMIALCRFAFIKQSLLCSHVQIPPGYRYMKFKSDKREGKGIFELELTKTSLSLTFIQVAINECLVRLPHRMRKSIAQLLDDPSQSNLTRFFLSVIPNARLRSAFSFIQVQDPLSKQKRRKMMKWIDSCLDSILLHFEEEETTEEPLFALERKRDLPFFDVQAHFAPYQQQEKEQRRIFQDALPPVHHSPQKGKFSPRLSKSSRNPTLPLPLPEKQREVIHHFTHKGWIFYAWPKGQCSIWMSLHPDMPHFKKFDHILSHPRNTHRIKRLKGKYGFLEISHPCLDIRPCGKLLTHQQIPELASLPLIKKRDYIIVFHLLRKHSTLKRLT